MSEPRRFPFLDAQPAQPGASLMPMLPLTLVHGEGEVAVVGLLDTGATVNVLPYSVGEQLGFDWEQQRIDVVLTGNLARFPSRGVIVTGSVGPFPPVRLAFAWTQSESAPLLLGQANFLMEFDVCFYRARQLFEIRPKTEP